MEVTKVAGLISLSDHITEDDLRGIVRQHAERLDELVAGVEERARTARQDRNLTDRGAANRIRDVATEAGKGVESLTATTRRPLQVEHDRLMPPPWVLLYDGAAPSAEDRATWPEVRDGVRHALEGQDMPDLWLAQRLRQAVDEDQRDLIAAVLDWPEPREVYGITDELLDNVHERLFVARRPDDVRRRNQLDAALHLIDGNEIRAVAAIEQAGGIAINEPEATII